MRKYELTYIAKPDLDASALAALIERVSSFVTSEGGAIVKTSQWGLRQLSYPIRKYREGYYVFSAIELEAPTLARLEQRLRLTEDIIRYLIVRADEDGNAANFQAADVMGSAADEAPATVNAATEASQALEQVDSPSTLEV